MVFAHCVYALSPGRLSEIAAPAREFGARLRLHAAESAAEAATAEARHGRPPVSNLQLRCGIAPVPRLLGAGWPSGSARTVRSAPPRSICSVRCGRRPVHKADGDPSAVGAERAVRMARAEGAGTLGLGDRLGSLEGGKRADLMLLDVGRPLLCPRHDVWPTPVYAAH